MPNKREMFFPYRGLHQDCSSSRLVIDWYQARRVERKWSYLATLSKRTVTTPRVSPRAFTSDLDRPGELKFLCE
jgi:hypothetical protein